MLNERIKQLKSLLRFRRDISRNQGVVVMGALLLATTLWFLVTLNQEYETPIKYPVVIDHVPAHVQMGEIHPAEVDLMVRGSGVDLLVEHLRMRRNALRFSYTNEFREGYMLTAPAMNQVFGHLASGLTPVRMITDSLLFTIDDRVAKKVPLVHQVNIRLKPAYQLEADPVMRPDSVLVQGPRALLDTLTAWQTVRIETDVLSAELMLSVPIVDTIPGFSVYPKTALLAIYPRLYTQLQLSLPVRIVDLPPGVTVRLAQEEVHISCLVPMDEYESLKAAQYQILIRYADIDQEVPHIIPRTDFLRQPVRVVSRSPAYISYVIVTRTHDAS